MIAISSKKLKALLLFAAKKDPRDYLNSLRVEASGKQALIVATDGAILGVYRVDLPESTTASFTVPRGAVEQALKLVKGDQDVIVCPDHIHSGAVDVPFTPLDSVYPDWRPLFKSVQKIEPGQTIPTFQAKLLKTLSDAALLISGNKYPGIQIHQNGKDGTALVRTSDPDFRGVIMPMRCNLDSDNVPEWILPEMRDAA